MIRKKNVGDIEGAVAERTNYQSHLSAMEDFLKAEGVFSGSVEDLSPQMTGIALQCKAASSSYSAVKALSNYLKAEMPNQFNEAAAEKVLSSWDSQKLWDMMCDKFEPKGL